MSDTCHATQCSLPCPAEVEGAIAAIAGLLALFTGLRPQYNSAERYDGKVFRMHSHSWVAAEQEFNFAWRDVRVRWCKYLGRSMTVNRLVLPEELLAMARECCGEVLALSLSEPGGFDAQVLS